jgi:hypothetical protein
MILLNPAGTLEAVSDHGQGLDEVKSGECQEHCAADTSVSASDATLQSPDFTSPRSGVALLPDCCVVRHGQAKRLGRTKLLAFGQSRRRPDLVHGH